MNPGTMILNKKRYAFAFNQKARRLFMEKHNLEFFADYEEKLTLLVADPVKGLSLKGMTVFCDLVITAIESRTPDFDAYDSDTLLEYFIEQPEKMNEIAGIFSASQEQERKKKSSSVGSGGKSKKSG